MTPRVSRLIACCGLATALALVPGATARDPATGPRATGATAGKLVTGLNRLGRQVDALIGGLDGATSWPPGELGAIGGVAAAKMNLLSAQVPGAFGIQFERLYRRFTAISGALDAARDAEPEADEEAGRDARQVAMESLRRARLAILSLRETLHAGHGVPAGALHDLEVTARAAGALADKPGQVPSQAFRTRVEGLKLRQLQLMQEHFPKVLKTDFWFIERSLETTDDHLDAAAETVTRSEADPDSVAAVQARLRKAKEKLSDLASLVRRHNPLRKKRRRRTPAARCEYFAVTSTGIRQAVTVRCANASFDALTINYPQAAGTASPSVAIVTRTGEYREEGQCTPTGTASGNTVECSGFLARPTEDVTIGITYFGQQRGANPGELETITLRRRGKLVARKQVRLQ
jgi:hypothetical protein